MEVGGAGERRLARVQHDQARAAVARPPHVLRHHREALCDVGTRDQDHLGLEHVGPWVRRPVDAERLLVGGRCRDHAQAPVVVDVPRAEPHTSELAHEVCHLGHQGRTGVHGERVATVRLLDPRDLRGHAVERLVPRGTPKGGLSRVADEGVEQPVAMVHLLVGGHALRAELEAVDLVVHRLDPEDASLDVDLEEHAALHAAVAAMRGHERDVRRDRERASPPQRPLPRR